MGYTTYFSGEIALDPPLNQNEMSYLEDFSNIWHTDTGHGPLFVAEDPHIGNNPNGDKPGLYCNWVPTGDGHLTWSENEKSYSHDTWLTWLISHLFGPEARAFVDDHVADDPRLQSFTCNHIASGQVNAQGEDFDDMWQIHVQDNVMEIRKAVVIYIPDVPVDQSNTNAGSPSVPDVQPAAEPAVPVLDVIKAYEQWIGGRYPLWSKNFDVFADAWSRYLTGRDVPCPDDPCGLHQVSDGSCDLCGSKNRT